MLAVIFFATEAVANATGSEIKGSRLDKSVLVARTWRFSGRGIVSKEICHPPTAEETDARLKWERPKYAFLRRKKPRVARSRVMMAGGAGAVLPNNSIRERMTGLL